MNYETPRPLETASEHHRDNENSEYFVTSEKMPDASIGNAGPGYWGQQTENIESRAVDENTTTETKPHFLGENSRDTISNLEREENYRRINAEEPNSQIDASTTEDARPQVDVLNTGEDIPQTTTSNIEEDKPQTDASDAEVSDQNTNETESEKEKNRRRLEKIRRRIKEVNELLNALMRELDDDGDNGKNGEWRPEEPDTPVQPEARDYFDKEGLLVPREMELRSKKEEGEIDSSANNSQASSENNNQSKKQNEGKDEALEFVFDQGVDELIQLEKEEQALSEKVS